MRVAVSPLLCWMIKSTGLVVAGLFFMESAHSAIWYLEPSATYRFKYDDNHLLTVDKPTEVLGHVLNIDAKFNYQSETSNLNLTPKVSLSRLRQTKEISDQQTKDNLDSNDFFIDLASVHASQWLDVQFNANVTQDSTELNIEDFDPDQALKTRRKWSLSPVLSYQFTELSNVNMGLSYLDVRYVDAQDVPSLVDYTYGNVFLGYTKSISPVHELSVSLSGSQLDPDSSVFVGIQPDFTIVETTINNTTNTYALQAELNYELSEKDKLKFSAGLRRSEITTETIDTNYVIDGSITVKEPFVNKTNNNGFLFELDYLKAFESFNWQFLTSRSVDPNGAGNLTQRDKVYLFAAYDFTAKLRPNIALQTVRIEELQDETIPLRIYSSAQLNLRWSFAQNWFSTGSYVYRTNHYTSGKNKSTTAESNSLLLSVTYKPTQARPYEIY